MTDEIPAPTEDDAPTWWVTVGSDDRQPTEQVMNNIREALDETLPADDNLVLTTDDVGPLSPRTAADIAEKLVAALDRTADYDPAGGLTANVEVDDE